MTIGAKDRFTGTANNNNYIMEPDSTWAGAVTVNAYTGEVVSLVGQSRSLDTYDGLGGTDTFGGTGGADAVVYDTVNGISNGPDRDRDSNAQQFVAMEQFFMGGGNDVLNLTSGPNGSTSYSGATNLQGGLGNDTIWGGQSGEIIVGENNVFTSGAGGADNLYGGGGNDTLFGDGRSVGKAVVLGDDTINGGAGNDLMFGDGQTFGQDFTGTRGHNSFVFDGPGSGQDTIGAAPSSGSFFANYFQHGLDKLFLAASYGYTAAQVFARTTDTGPGGFARVDLGGPDSITLYGVHKADLTVDDFVIGSPGNPAAPVAGTVTSLTIADDSAVNLAESGGPQVTVIGSISAPLAPGESVLVTIGGASLTATVSGLNFSVDVPTPTADGIVTAKIAAFGGGSGAATSQAYIVDTTAPTISLDTVAGDDRLNASEAAGSFSVTGTTVGVEDGQLVTIAIKSADGQATYSSDTTTVTGDSWSYDVPSGVASLLQDGSYLVVASVSDLADNPAPNATRSFVVDTTAPTLAITSSASQLRAGETAQVTFTFSEGPGASFAWDGNSGDVAVTGGTLGALSGNGLTRTATFTPAAGLDAGTASITVASGLYADAAGNPGGAGASPSLTVDTRAPTATITTAASPSNAGELTYTVTFSETVTGVSADDFAVVSAGGAAATVGAVTATGTPGQYTVRLTGVAGDGALRLDLKAGTDVQDAAGNLAGGMTGGVITLDHTAPDLTLALTAGGATPMRDAASGALVLNAAALAASLHLQGSLTDAHPGSTAKLGFVAADGHVVAPRSMALTIDGAGVDHFDFAADAAFLAQLSDGGYTVQVASTDAAGNVGQGPALAFLVDTTADLGADAHLVLDPAGDGVLTGSEAGRTAFAIAGLDADATGLASFSDGVHTTSLAVAANGSYAVDLSGFTGSVTASLDIADLHGNTVLGTGGLVTIQQAAAPPPGVTDDGTIYGTPDADIIHAGQGNSQVYALGGDDIVFGEGGGDGIYGGDGNDFIGAGEGDDLAAGGDGNDEVHGEVGDDQLFGNRGNDGLYGEAGNDQVRGGEGDDRVFGGTGDDGLYGEEGNDFLGGGAGNDLLSGGAGNDALVGEDGNDELWGNAGNDLFSFVGQFGQDRIEDFGTVPGDFDVLEFRSDAFAGYQDVMAHAQQMGSDVVITVGANTVTLEKVILTNLTQDHFHFV